MNQNWQRMFELKQDDWLAVCKEVDRLKAECDRYKAALEKIADPRKRDHQEPDAYTQLGCVMNIADIALAKLKDNQDG